MSIENWQAATSVVYKELNRQITENDPFDELFGGFKVWYSDQIENPKILLIGINPGRNEKSKSKDINFNFSLELEYLADKRDYKLANSIKRVFAAAGLTDVLQNSTMKTNYYHIITNQMSDLKYLNKVSKGLLQNYELDAAKSIKSLIEIVKPQYIVCEGKSVYQKVCSLYDGFAKQEWQDDCGFSVISPSYPTIIGFSRLHSNIKNPTRVSELLKTTIKEGN
jgi:hypothetical protein